MIVLFDERNEVDVLIPRDDHHWLVLVPLWVGMRQNVQEATTAFNCDDYLLERDATPCEQLGILLGAPAERFHDASVARRVPFVVTRCRRFLGGL